MFICVSVLSKLCMSQFILYVFTSGCLPRRHGRAPCLFFCFSHTSSFHLSPFFLSPFLFQFLLSLSLLLSLFQSPSIPFTFSHFLYLLLSPYLFLSPSPFSHLSLSCHWSLFPICFSDLLSPLHPPPFCLFPSL